VFEVKKEIPAYTPVQQKHLPRRSGFLKDVSRPDQVAGVLAVFPGRVDRLALEILVENYRSFLRFLERRVGSREDAEDILQDAFTRNLAKVEDVSEEAIIPWFYRTLRNAAIDHHRRRVTAEKAFEAFAKEIETAENPPEDLYGEICACVRRLASTLKPEYAEILEAVDVNGTPVKAFATEKGVSPSNAGVRLFRAREALRRRVIESCGTCAEHGCFNCSCRARPNEPTGV
jgi:RNA polymerase sigma-70 factor (ECF subfamily)